MCIPKMKPGKKKKSNVQSFEDDNTNGKIVKRVDVVSLFGVNINNYSKQLLYCDAPFDIRYFTNTTFYDQEYQRTQKRVLSFQTYKEDRISFIELESNCTQQKDVSGIIHQLRSLSSLQAYKMSLQIEKNYQLYKEQLQAIELLEKKGCNLISNAEAIYQKAFDIIKHIMKTQTKYLLFNLISMDFELKEMKKKYAGATFDFGKIILSNKDILTSSIMKMGNFNFGGDMINFTKHQFPECDEKEVSMCIHTLDGFMIPCISKLVSIPLCDNKFNILLVKQFKIDPLLIERLQIVRKRMSTFNIESILAEDRYGDRNYVNLQHSTFEGIQFEQFSYQQEENSQEQQDQNSSKNNFPQNSQFGDESINQNCLIQNYYQRNEQDQQQQSQMQQNRESDILSASGENNIIGEEENLMSFEPPDFCESEKSNQTKSFCDSSQQLQNDCKIKIQQNFSMLKSLQKTIKENKQEEIKFINTFYQPTINL